jgi:hypothetical protein
LSRGQGKRLDSCSIRSHWNSNNDACVGNNCHVVRNSKGNWSWREDGIGKVNDLAFVALEPKANPSNMGAEGLYSYGDLFAVNWPCEIHVIANASDSHVRCSSLGGGHAWLHPKAE